MSKRVGERNKNTKAKRSFVYDDDDIISFDVDLKDDDFDDNTDVDLFSEHIEASVLEEVNRAVGGGHNIDDDFVAGDEVDHEYDELQSKELKGRTTFPIFNPNVYFLRKIKLKKLV